MAADRQTTTNEGAEVLRVYAENERRCGRFEIAKDLDNAADEIDRLVGALRPCAEETQSPRSHAIAEALAIGRRILADMDSAARVAPIESRGQDAAAYFSVRAYMRAIEELAITPAPQTTP